MLPRETRNVESKEVILASHGSARELVEKNSKRVNQPELVIEPGTTTRHLENIGEPTPAPWRRPAIFVTCIVGSAFAFAVGMKVHPAVASVIAVAMLMLVVRSCITKK